MSQPAGPQGWAQARMIIWSFGDLLHRFIWWLSSCEHGSDHGRRFGKGGCSPPDHHPL